MSIASKIESLQTDKTNIASAITAKGGTVNSGDGYDDFATGIGTIETSGIEEWVKPADWPDIESVTFDDLTVNEIYFLFDNTLPCKQVSINNFGATATVYRGTIVSGAFVGEQIATGSSFTDTITETTGTTVYKVVHTGTGNPYGFQLRQTTYQESYEACVWIYASTPLCLQYGNFTYSLLCYNTQRIRFRNLPSTITYLGMNQNYLPSLKSVLINDGDFSGITMTGSQSGCNFLIPQTPKCVTSLKNLTIGSGFTLKSDSFKYGSKLDLRGVTMSGTANQAICREDPFCEEVDTTGASIHPTNTTQCFSKCPKLKKLNLSGFYLDAVTSDGQFMIGLPALKELTINSSWNRNIDVQSSLFLTRDSILHLLNTVPEVSSTKTLTLGTTNRGKVTASEIAVATEKGWTVA